MQLIINFAISGSGYRAIPVEDLRIDDLYAKEPDEVEQEISKKLSDILELVYEEIYRG